MFIACDGVGLSRSDLKPLPWGDGAEHLSQSMRQAHWRDHATGILQSQGSSLRDLEAPEGTNHLEREIGKGRVTNLDPWVDRTNGRVNICDQ
jgi:hypothetical protein